MEENKKKMKVKYFIIGIVIGMPLGIVIGIAIGNIAIGPSIGLSFGAGLGVLLDARYNKTEENILPTGKRKIASIVLIGIIALAVMALLVTFFIEKS